MEVLTIVYLHDQIQSLSSNTTFELLQLQTFLPCSNVNPRALYEMYVSYSQADELYQVSISVGSAKRYIVVYQILIYQVRTGGRESY